ncbi:SET domain group 4 [Salvia divinorum]|uniref:SET domain group 4 n=1 Tax=Salvia divinorum TaxID=28513 RepID=A0ABD1FGW0_SALDI
MPCLSNLINLPASAFPELKPIVYDTRLGPKQAPAVARPRDLDAMKLGPQSEETIDDVKQGELRRNGKGEGAIGRGPNPEFDLKRNLGSFSGPKIGLHGADVEDGWEIERTINKAVPNLNGSS